jgi:hypothetical protein
VEKHFSISMAHVRSRGGFLVIYQFKITNFELRHRRDVKHYENILM